jgi:hypothetical protein
MGKVSSFWRTSAVILAAGLVASIALAPANAGSSKSVLGKTHTFITEAQVAASANQATDALCPSGQKAVGGGVNFLTPNPPVDVVWNEPLVEGDNLTAASEGKNPGANGWRVRVNNTSVSSAFTYSVGVVCAKVVKVSG